MLAGCYLSNLKQEEPAARDCDTRLAFYEDADGDGYGNELSVVLACSAAEGWVEAAGDCDDTDATRASDCTVDTGTDTGAETGTDTAPDSGTDTGTETGTDTSPDTGTDDTSTVDTSTADTSTDDTSTIDTSTAANALAPHARQVPDRTARRGDLPTTRPC